MKIISGMYKGRNLKGYTIDGTRPTQDRVKESIFSMIQNYIQDSTVLDLFAGSGNLGIEALSNGANLAYFVDINSIAIKTIKENLNTLKVENAKTFCLDYKKALIEFKNDSNIKFDLVFLDPPYKDLVLDEILTKLIEYQLLNEDAIIVCEYEIDHLTEKYEGLELLKEKKYGYKFVKIYQKCN